MNIAILLPELSGGGAQRAAQILGNYYVEKGNRVYYFIRDINIKQDYWIKGKVIKVPIKSCMEAELNDMQRIFRLLISSVMIRKLKWKYRIDVSISFMEEFNYLNILSKGKEKVIVRVCTILSKRPELSGLVYRKNIINFFYSKADRIVVMSQYALKEMRDNYGIPLKKITKIPNAVIDRKLQEDTKSWKYGEKVIVCVGRLDPVKQQERILRAFSYVSEREEQARLVILGKGPSLNYLRRLCAKYQIVERVVFTGFTENVPYYLQNARVFVMASKVEGFPNSMIEAMNYGVPIITTDSPGACGEIVGKDEEKVVEGDFLLCKYGVLTPDMPSEKIKVDLQLKEQEIILGKAILKVLNDEDIYQEYRRQSFKRADMFHINKVMKKWDSIITNG